MRGAKGYRLLRVKKMHIMKTWGDYLLVNQLEISCIRIDDNDHIIVALNNKYSDKLFYVLFYNYWNYGTVPDFRWKAMHEGANLTDVEMNELKIKMQQVLRSVLQFKHKEESINEEET